MPTNSGWAVLAAGVSLGLLAALTGYPQLVALAAAAGTALLLARAMTPAPQVELDADWAVPRTVEGGRTALEVLVRNSGGRRSAATRLTAELVGLDGPVTVLEKTAAVLEAGDSLTVALDTPPLPRGLYFVTAVISDCSDVLGLFRRRRRSVCDLTLTVQPDTVDLRAGRRRGEADPDVGRVLGPRRPGETFHALRDYQPGDDVRLINWMATARTGKPVIRELIRADVVRQAVVLDTSAEAHRAGSFDVAVQVTGSLALAAAAAGETWLLSTTGLHRHYGSGGSRDDVLDPLAAVRGPSSGQDGERLHEVAVPRQATAVTVITGPVPDERRWRALAGPRDLAIVSIADDVPSGTTRNGPRVLAVPLLRELAPRMRAVRR